MKRILAFLLTLCLLVVHPVTLRAAEQEEPEELPSTQESEEFSRALARMGQVYDPALSALTIPEALTKQPSKDYTVMIYMIGSNLESVNASATSDLTEIENSGVDYSKANVICYTGGSRRWFSDVPCDRNSILDMSRPAEDRIVAGTEANADMGASLTLSNFINFCTDYYPADHYMMIFWDHGGGPIMGYGSDELFSYDALLLTELREAMDETIFAKEKKLDLVGFDACLMGCLENMVLWSSYADYYIGSEELEPGDGWNYAFLSSLNKSTDPIEVGRSVVDMYQSYYEAKISETYNPDLTLSLIDLSKIPQATDAVSAISEVLTDDMTAAGFAEIQRTRSDVKSFGYIAPASENEDATYYDLADLKDLASNFEDTYPAAAKKVMDAVDAMVVHQYASVSHASGVSFYFPLQNKWMYLGGTDILSATNFSRQYAHFLNDYALRWVEAKAHDWLLGALEEETDSYTLKLTEDQMASTTGVFLEVLHLDSFMNYVPVLTGYALDIEEDGTVRVPKDPSLVLLSSGKDAYDGSTLWPVSVTEQSEERYVYHLSNTRVYNSLDMDITSRDVTYEDVDVSISSAPDSDEVQIKDVKASSSIGALGKNTIDITGWETLGYNWRGYLPTKGVKGETLPFTQWERDYIGTTYFSIDDGFQIEKKPLSQIHSSFALQVILKDTSGDFYATDIVKVTGIEEQKVSVPTDQGVMEFTISDGEAYLSAYAGNDTKLEIPAKAEDAPVTGIGEVDAYNDTVTEIVFPSSMKKMGYNALSGFKALEKVKLNEGLDTIGSFAFGYTNITELDLPSSVRSIEKCAFSKMRSLTKIDLNSGIETMHTAVFMDCPALAKVTLDGKDTGDAKGFCLLNGVIYSTDKKSLIAYPGAGPDTYTVEPGTETIEYAAFYGGNVKNVTLPSSLKTIGHFAFYECHQLAVPTLPQGLETIRSQAFGATLYALTISHDFMTPVKIKIPASVQHIGPGAFDVFQAREFEVDKGNTIYSDLNGALMNLRGDCLIAPASDGRGTLIIPDGALSFEWDMVDYLENYTDDFLMMDQYDIILPASITQMPIEEYLYTKENLRFHCPVGSVAETYAIEHEIAYDHITDLTYSLQEVKPDDTTVLRFRIYSDHAMLEHVETSSTALTIPDTVDGKPVTTIGSGTYGLLADPTEMFSYNSNSTVESIQLPATVTEISDDSFEYFNGLTTMDLPAGLLYLGSDALPYKYDLKELPEGLVSIGRCFAGSTTTEIKIPASLKNIALDAFGHYEALQKITVDPGNTTFSDKDGVLFDQEGTTLIYYPKGGNTKYAIPEGTQYIGNGAFYNNKTIEEVTLPAGIKSIDQNGFYYCSALNSIDLPEGLMEIGAHAFNNCEALKKVEFPGSVRIIDSFAFSYCSSLNEVTFNEGLEKIGPNAFYNTALTRVELPDSVETIDYSAFDLSQIEEPRGEGFTLHIGPRLTDLASNAFGAFPIEAYDVDPENPSYMAVEGLLTDRTGERLLSCPPGIQGELHIPDSITWLNYSSFDTAYFLTDLYIPSTVTKIESISLPSKYVKNDDDDDYHSVYKVTIHCQKGSAAETYAIENDIPYVIE